MVPYTEENDQRIRLAANQILTEMKATMERFIRRNDGLTEVEKATAGSAAMGRMMAFWTVHVGLAAKIRDEEILRDEGQGLEHRLTTVVINEVVAMRSRHDVTL